MRDNDTLKRKVMEFGDMQGRVNEYEYKLEMVTKEIERLNGIVENKNRDISVLEGKAREGEANARQLQHLVTQITKITAENKDLHDDVRNSQEKLRLSSQQHNQLLNELN